ncbi:MAG: PSD1 domain-containing protein [Pirellulales bacterium]|nr:PSD1 domain-containing protein [Pirellulales bacterium]
MNSFDRRSTSLRLAVGAWLLTAPPGASAASAGAPTYNRDVRPILSDHCFACHGPDSAAREADLRLDRAESAHESAIVPGDVDGSELINRVMSDDPDVQMPPADSKKPRLSPEQVELLRKWIDDGARYEPHWAYIPPERPAVPEVGRPDLARNEIDRFVLARLAALGVEPSPEAEPTTLVRRLYFDLTGLPPTPSEVDEYLNDSAPDAYERLVDRLLASEAYGERMASWWFDLVRFANTVGYHGDQEHRITPYRDYVIKSFNENLPFDQFTIEQLAGDLLPNPTMWQLVASGYNRLLQTTHEGGAQDAEYRAKHLADRVRNVSEAWLGASVGCAECHDHKFDPYTQDDFYSLGAFFADVDHYGSFVPVASNDTPTQRPPEMLAWTLPVYRAMEQCDRRIAELESSLVGRLDAKWTKRRDELINLKRQRLELEAQFEPTMITQAVEPQVIRVLPRGNWLDQSGPVVQPHTPHFLRQLDTGDRRATRLDLARWLVARDQPLTARVAMNRLWQRLFGVGLSKTTIDIGSQGEWPVNQALVDWLAVEFMESGWDVKHMMRLLVASSAYRQSSQPRPELDQVDPDNRLVARQSRHRLDAEEIRDNALAVSGLLARQIGGGVSRPYQPAGYYAALNFPEREYQASTDREQFRRSVYVHWQRQFLHPWLLALDAPTREECTAQRPLSNTPAAALVLLNDPSFVEAARALAARTLADGGASDGDRLRWAWRAATGRQGASEEIALLGSLLEQHRAHYAAHAGAAAELISVGISPRNDSIDAAELAAWTSVARTLLNLNETIFRN